MPTLAGMAEPTPRPTTAEVRLTVVKPPVRENSLRRGWDAVEM